MNINFHYRSPNFDDRASHTGIEYIIMHYTACDFKTSLRCLMENREINPVSSHYLVDLDGTIYNLVEEKMRAWHAGVSYWQNKESLNTWSIGIEIVNLGFGYEFPNQQMLAVKDLSLDIMQRHNIKKHNVIGHSDIAPGRKSDPGEMFNWKWLAEHGVGIFPDRIKNVSCDNVLALLEQIGYDCKNPAAAIEAFKLHFCPNEHDYNIMSATAHHVLQLLRDSK